MICHAYPLPVPEYQHLHWAACLSAVACAALQVIYYSSTSSWQCPSVPMAAGVGTYVVVASDLYQGGAACGQCMSVVSSPPNSAVTPFIAQVRCSSAWGIKRVVGTHVGQTAYCSLSALWRWLAWRVNPLQSSLRNGGGLATSLRTAAAGCLLAQLCPQQHCYPPLTCLARVQVVGEDTGLASGSIGAGQNFGGEYGVAVSMVPCPGAAQNAAAVIAATVAPTPPPNTTIAAPVVVATTPAPVATTPAPVATTPAPVVAAATTAVVTNTTPAPAAASSSGWTAQVTGALVSQPTSDTCLGSKLMPLWLVHEPPPSLPPPSVPPPAAKPSLMHWLLLHCNPLLHL